MIPAPSFRAFGKLPSHPDFLQLGANSAEFVRFDDWLTEGVEWAHSRAGAAFRDAFSGSGIRAFVYVAGATAHETSLIVGALAPSHDAAGRLFPISIVASPLVDRDFSGEPQLLPLACEEIWQSASACLVDLRAGTADDPAQHLATLPAQSVLAFADAQASYEAWSDTLPLSELWALISGAPHAEGLREILRWVAEAVRPHRHREPPNTRLALRLPLGPAGGAAVCFWLDVVRRLIGWRRTVPSFFWAHDGSSGQVTIHLGAPALSSIAELWLPTRSRDEVCDLTVDTGAHGSAGLPPLSATVERAVSGPSSVATFLASLSGD